MPRPEPIPRPFPRPFSDMNFERNGAFEDNEIEDMDVSSDVNERENVNTEGISYIDGNARFVDVCNNPNLTFEEFVKSFKMFDK